MKRENQRRHTPGSFLTDLYRSAARQMREILSDLGVITFVFLVPLGYPVVYAFIYTNETVREVPVVAVDKADTPASREFLRRTDASPDIRIAYRAGDMQEAEELLARKKAYGIVYLPPEFEKQTVRGEQATVSLYCDMSSLLKYKAMLATLTDVSLDMGRELQADGLDGLTLRQAQSAVLPIDNQWTPLFNIHSGFAGFLIPAILVLIVQQTMLLGIGMSTGTARQQRRMRDFVLSPGGSVLAALLGRCLVYTLLYTAIVAYMAVVIPGIFSLPRIGSPITLVLFLAPYLLACAFFSMLLATVLRTREACMPAFVFTSVPFLFLSGISWPQASVPLVWKIVGWFVPSTSGIQGFIKIDSMGACLADVRFEYLSLWALTLLYGVLAYAAYERIGRRLPAVNGGGK